MHTSPFPEEFLLSESEPRIFQIFSEASFLLVSFAKTLHYIDYRLNFYLTLLWIGWSLTHLLVLWRPCLDLFNLWDLWDLFLLTSTTWDPDVSIIHAIGYNHPYIIKFLFTTWCLSTTVQRGIGGICFKKYLQVFYMNQINFQKAPESLQFPSFLQTGHHNIP